DGAISYSEIQTAKLEGSSEELSVYPNPVGANQVLNVRLFSTKAQVELTIKDMMSRTVKIYTLDDNLDGEHNFELFIDDLSAGIYFLQTSSGEVIQFVKE
ncbi:MAG: T9SS type A sorting domain-containing protein, partial [Bacteroidota bacterium]